MAKMVRWRSTEATGVPKPDPSGAKPNSPPGLARRGPKSPSELNPSCGLGPRIFAASPVPKQVTRLIAYMLSTKAQSDT
jgi:hypothetical protein